MTTTARRRRRGFTGCGEDKKKEERIMEKFLLEDFAGGAVAERIGSAIQRVYENIANPNMDAEKARKLTIELTFKPDKNDRTDVDVTAIVKTSLQPEKAISSRMIVEATAEATCGNEWRREARKGQLEIDREEAETQETSGGVIDLQAQKRKVE